ncbi:helix-turn-helix domain-containing protein [Marinisporobacter balticus]|uniref:helix-turn-helix domain-containing protein n=1 Tax=Marinisporobacter balticus TaxID=2018667 RepID=UPI0010461071
MVEYTPYSKKTWSEHLNVSRPSLFRELKILCTQQVIRIRNKEILILKEDALIDILNN